MFVPALLPGHGVQRPAGGLGGAGSPSPAQLAGNRAGGHRHRGGEWGDSHSPVNTLILCSGLNLYLLYFGRSEADAAKAVEAGKGAGRRDPLVKPLALDEGRLAVMLWYLALPLHLLTTYTVPDCRAPAW